MPEFSDLPRKLRAFLEKKQAPHGFTRDNAVEKFRLVAAAGSDGQEPILFFEKGSTLVLNDFPPGTILREKYVDSGPREKICYIWWCVGDHDEENKTLEIFDAFGKGLSRSSSVLPNIPLLGAIKRRLISERSDGDVDYKVGKPGILIDLVLKHRDSGYDGRPGWKKLPETRHTIKIDVIEYGTRVKGKKEGEAPEGLEKLRLAPKRAR